MSSTTERIIQSLDSPADLEALYREDSPGFQDALSEAIETAPDSVVLRVWQARLDYRPPETSEAGRLALIQALAIGAGAGALLRLPALWADEQWYYQRFALLWMILGAAAYFLVRNRDWKRSLVVAPVTLVTAIYVSLLPDNSDSVVMALIHLPILFVACVGLAFMGDGWHEPGPRIRFLRYGGELVVLGALVGLGGLVLSALTLGLFSLIAEDIEQWYFANIGVWGLAAIPVLATFLYDRVFERRTAISAVLARVFAPLFLIMVTVYLAVTFIAGKNPFIDRDFLIIFNGLLLLVLGISVFSLLGQDRDRKPGLSDYVSLLLVALTLAMNALALAAIVFRLASFGLTPNRVAVVGANIVVFIHLAWIFIAYLQAIRARAGFVDMERVVARYLPVYAGWAALVAFLLPLAFSFR